MKMWILISLNLLMQFIILEIWITPSHAIFWHEWYNSLPMPNFDAKDTYFLDYICVRWNAGRWHIILTKKYYFLLLWWVDSLSPQQVVDPLNQIRHHFEYQIAVRRFYSNRILELNFSKMLTFLKLSKHNYGFDCKFCQNHKLTVTRKLEAIKILA